MERSVLIRQAYDCDGRVVRVADAVKGQRYVCPQCGEPLKFRHGEYRQPHFAHCAGGHCTHESTLHAIFKRKAAELFRELIAEEKGFPLAWKCNSCGAGYSNGDLLHRAASVAVEHDLGACRPDVALLDADGKAVVAFEVVVTHQPEPQAVTYYDEHGIVMVKVNLERDKELDFNDLEGVIRQRAEVSLCCNRVCEGYKAASVNRSIITIAETCSRCNGNYEVYAALHRTALGDFPIRDLTSEEVAGLRKPGLVTYEGTLRGRKIITIGTPCKCRQSRPKREVDPYVSHKGRRQRLSSVKKKMFD